jgi:MtN3 and saliva related transmembrane protein
MADVLGPIAAAWGVLMAISPSLQIRRMLIRRSSRDVSMGYLLVLQVGFALWLGYGVALGNGAIIVPNSVAFLVGLAAVAVTIRYRTGPPGSTAQG